MRITKREELKVRQRLGQICSGLVSDGWQAIVAVEEVSNPFFGFTALRTFRHRRGGSLAVKVEETRLEIWRNGKLRHEEVIHAE